MSINVKEYDAIGIGFGPANLAIAIALQEISSERDFNCCFLERKPQFEWHGGMLLDGTRMQISFLKDLVTQRNPLSPFSFVNYLHQHKRLNSFINMSTFQPTRVEFNDYLTWAAGHFSEQVKYSQNVVAIEPIEDNGEVKKVKVITENADGERQERITRSLIIGMGGSPKLPPQFEGKLSSQVIHSSAYKFWRDQAAPAQDNANIAIIGAGQSAAEIFVDMAGRYEQGSVNMINRGYALHPADDSPFVNEIFNPEFTDQVYARTQEQRQALLQRFSGTNYSVVDVPELNAIYERLYLQNVTGQGNHNYLANHEVVDVAQQDEKVSLLLRDKASQGQSWQQYDAVILATGYQYQGYSQLLAPLQSYMAQQEVERCYRVPMQEHCKVNIFLQGCCEDTHGLSDTLLSVLAIRSHEVVSCLTQQFEQKPQTVA